jgi:hypothetical protein
MTELDGTPRALKPVAEATLAWVAQQRENRTIRKYTPSVPTDDELRRIELCALAALDVAAFEILYTPTQEVELHADGEEAQGQRGAPEGVPGQAASEASDHGGAEGPD